MFNRYQFNGKDLKEYKVSRVKSKVSKNGKPYTVFQIASQEKQPDGTNKFDNQSIFSWQEDLNLADGDKIVITDVKGWDCKLDTYNGQTTVSKLFYCDVKITQSNATPKQPEVVDNGLGALEDLSDSLPF